MSDSQSRWSEVEVRVDPVTAFTAFTDELDLWWVRGPINSYGAGKLVAMRCEPGIGGRLVEVYDQDTGAGLELARITAWEPGKHLAWQSSLDDVRIDVRFDATENGTIVRLQASIPEGGSDTGGTAIIQVTPRWFGAWVAKRDTTSHGLHDLARFALTLHYARPAAAARWLAAAFGFESPNALHVSELGVIHRRADQLDNGATILQGITSYGVTSYVALDIEGRSWRFAEARPTQPR